MSELAKHRAINFLTVSAVVVAVAVVLGIIFN